MNNWFKVSYFRDSCSMRFIRKHKFKAIALSLLAVGSLYAYYKLSNQYRALTESQESERRRVSRSLQQQFYVLVNEQALRAALKRLINAITNEIFYNHPIESINTDSLTYYLKQNASKISKQEKKIIWSQLKQRSLLKLFFSAYAVPVLALISVVQVNLLGRYLCENKDIPFSALTGSLPASSSLTRTYQKISTQTQQRYLAHTKNLCLKFNLLQDVLDVVRKNLVFEDVTQFNERKIQENQHAQDFPRTQIQTALTPAENQQNILHAFDTVSLTSKVNADWLCQSFDAVRTRIESSDDLIRIVAKAFESTAVHHSPRDLPTDSIDSSVRSQVDSINQSKSSDRNTIDDPNGQHLTSRESKTSTDPVLQTLLLETVDIINTDDFAYVLGNVVDCSFTKLEDTVRKDFVSDSALPFAKIIPKIDTWSQQMWKGVSADSNAGFGWTLDLVSDEGVQDFAAAIFLSDE